ncbi:MAG: hypothetical protein CSA58_02965 [Micrococcales bacterium]|nr:MAG: hypothetical protein CSB46_11030 [Micrococcales bacterium]PIE27694.1 MAG: hypothetical protein CSA58_02965 [Micrococcales bacterium]
MHNEEFDDYDPLFDDADDAGRPSFITAFDPATATEPTTADADSGDQVRSYLLTGGRTGGGRSDVSMETIVTVNPAADHTLVQLPEHHTILTACQSPTAVAEIAAVTHLPLGVAQVLVGDLVADGHLNATTRHLAMHEDIAFLERLIDRVSAL